MTVKLVSDEKIAETSSKGNQEKWFDAAAGLWYKLDQFGYEALSETVVSTLLQHSNIETAHPFRFVRYNMQRLKVHGRERTGCCSENFLLPGQNIVTLSHLFRQEFQEPLSRLLGRQTSDRKRIEWLAKTTAALTGLDDFPRYLTLLFETDALFLNEDRHLNNIAVLQQGGTFDYCPIFDNGAALLSNTQLYRLDIDPAAHIKLLRARPFNTTFNRQVISARNLFGAQLSVPKFTRTDILSALEDILPYYAPRDRGLIADRVCACILTRQKMNA